jgi:glycosyltransferase involved in cell wall biosynthesis
LKISIVTCCWNSEPYIEKCIESVREQSYPDIEHVFVDGGSTDGTLERIRSLGNKARYVTDVRGGISVAMNVGAMLAEGDVVAHLHGDDYYLGPTSVEKVANALAESKKRWAFGRTLSDIDGKLIPHRWQVAVRSREQLLWTNFIPHAATFYRRDFFLELGGFDTSLKYAMDYDMWLKMVSIEIPAYVDGEIAAFRRHAGSVSNAQYQKAFQEDHEVRRRYIGHNPLVRMPYEAAHLWRALRLRRNF